MLALVAAFGLVASCTPAQKADVAIVAPALKRAACVVLHAAAHDGTIDTICATADELAPIVRTLLEARATEPDAGTSTLGLAVALRPIAELAVSPRRVARRHCALWVPVVRSEAGALDASPE